MSSVKRKAPSAASPSNLAASAISSASNKRTRLDSSSSGKDAAAQSNIEGDLDLEEQDRKRSQQGRKGRVITQGYESESSDEDDQDGGTHRRNSERKNKTTGAQDDDDDMFDMQDDQDANQKPGEGSTKKKKRYLQLGEVEGQEFSSKTRRQGGSDTGSVAETDEDLDPDLELESSGGEDDNDADMDLNARGERTPPTSPGGTPLRMDQGRKKSKAASKKSKSVKITGFNMKEEMKTGKFDQDGNFIENAQDPHSQHDAWLAGNYSRRKIKAAREAQQKAERELRKKEALAEQQDNDEDELKKSLVEIMRRGETVLGTLQRFGKESKNLSKGAHERKGYRKKNDADAKSSDQSLGPDQGSATLASREKTQVVKDLEMVTHLSSTLMSKFGHMSIYEETYESLLKAVRKSGLVRATFDPAAQFDLLQESPTVHAHNGSDLDGSHQANRTPNDLDSDSKDVQGSTQWEYRWTPSYLAAAVRASGDAVSPDVEVFGPYSKADLRSWAQGGYFGIGGERILLRPTGSTDRWKGFSDCFGDA